MLKDNITGYLCLVHTVSIAMNADTLVVKIRSPAYNVSLSNIKSAYIRIYLTLKPVPVAHAVPLETAEL